MPGPEQYPHDPLARPEVPTPLALPEELAAFLKDKDYAALLQATDTGTVLVVKAPSPDIQSMRGRVPIHLRHELYEHESAPVIRMVTRMYDQPERPLALETFINVEDEQQRADYAALQQQDRLHLLFYDEALQHRLTKAVALGDPETFAAILHQADRLFAAIPEDRFDFDRAKQAVMERTGL